MGKSISHIPPDPWAMRKQDDWTANYLRQKPNEINCPSCGAPNNNNNCEYCGRAHK